MKKFLATLLTVVISVAALFAFNIRTSAASSATIRVRLSSMGYISSLSIKTAGEYAMPNGNLLTKNTDYVVTISGSTLQLKTGTTIVYSTTGDYFCLKKKDTSLNGLIIKNTNTAYGTINYLGNFAFVKGTNSFEVINELDFETYLIGVVPREIGENAGQEALRAQAVAARTYAIRSLSDNDDPTDYNYLHDTAKSQVYMGYSAATPKAEQAVKDTCGKVLKYNGAYASANYTASNGGQAQAADNIFQGGYYAYLITHDDEYDLRSTKAAKTIISFPKQIANTTTTNTMDSRLLTAIQSDLKLALYKAGYSIDSADYSLIGFKSIQLSGNRYPSPSRVYNYANVTAQVKVYKRDAAKDGATVEYARLSSTEYVTLYQGPGTSFSEVAYLKYLCARVKVLERRSDGWVRIQTPGGTVGYCVSTSLIPADTFASSTVHAADALQETVDVTFQVAAENIREAYAATKSLSYHTIWAVETATDSFAFIFRGNGHAVGMSQEGAMVMGAEGKTYQQILSFYYPGTTLETASYAVGTTPAPSPTLIPGALYGTVKLSDVSSNLNIRESASASAAIIGKAPHGSRLQILENNGEWLKIAIVGYECGYVMASYVVIDTEPIPTLSPSPSPTPVPTVTPLPTPSPAPTVKPTAIPTAKPTATPVPVLYGVVINTSSLNVRSGASTKYGIVATLAKGAKVIILKKNASGSWHYIQLSNNTRGYVSGNYISLTSSSTGFVVPTATPKPTATAQTTYYGVVINTSSLNVRSGASTKYGIVAALTKGTKVKILKKNASGSWHYIQMANNIKGYVSANYISLTTSSSGFVTATATAKPSTTTAATVIGTVKVSNSLLIRSGPGTGYSSIGSLTNGTKVTILSTSGSWYNIRTSSGKVGYVSKSYVVISTSSTATAATAATTSSSTSTKTVTATVNVRKGSSTSYGILGVLYKNAKVQVLGTSGNWYKIQYGTATGYVYKTYLK